MPRDSNVDSSVTSSGLMSRFSWSRSLMVSMVAMCLSSLSRVRPIVRDWPASRKGAGGGLKGAKPGAYLAASSLPSAANQKPSKFSLNTR